MADISRMNELATELIEELDSIDPAQGARLRAASGNQFEPPAVRTRLNEVKNLTAALLREDERG